MSGEKPGVREAIERMAGEMYRAAKAEGRSDYTPERCREIARQAAERVEHGRPSEKRERQKDR